MAHKGKIAVTGAEGFIGSHLCEHLVSQGYHVRACVLYNSFGQYGWLDHIDKAIFDQLELEYIDVRDYETVDHAVKSMDIVLHLAALITIPWSYRAAKSYVDTNITGTLNIVEAARRHNISRVVSTSTSEVYGTALHVPIDEDHPLQGQSPYAASKIAADQMALSYYRSHNVPVTVLRPFNTYGPRQSVRAVMPTVIMQMLDARAKGLTDCPLQLGALHPTRDFSYVKDIAKGFEAIMGCDAALGDVVNIGSGFEISIADMVQIAADHIGVTYTLSEDVKRLRPEKSEVYRLFAATDKAQKMFNWSPDHGGLDGFKLGLGKTIDWFAEEKNRARYPQGSFSL